MRIVGGAGGGGQHVAGSIEICGRPLHDYTQRELARRMSYVPQADGRLSPFTVEQFVQMGRYPHLRPLAGLGPDDRRAVRQALELTATGELAPRRLSTLSGGERQRVYIAAALAQQAEILLLDEPTTFLDYRHQAEIRSLLARVNRQEKVTILAVTHDANAAALECQQVVALRDGQVAFAGSPAELMNARVLEGIYATPFRLVPHPDAGLPIVVPPVVERAAGDVSPDPQEPAT